MRSVNCEAVLQGGVFPGGVSIRKMSIAECQLIPIALVSTGTRCGWWVRLPGADLQNQCSLASRPGTSVLPDVMDSSDDPGSDRPL